MPETSPTKRKQLQSPKAESTQKASKRPGRPEGTNYAREAILDTAEEVFADLGYAGTTLREIANRTEVTQALISYYFGSKQGLFREVFLRRGRLIGQQRLEGLTKLEKQKSAPNVAQLVHAFLAPIIELYADPRSHAFMRLQARLHTEPADISYDLRNEVYNPSTHLFVKLLRKAVPHLSETDAFWRTTLLVGAYLYAFSDTHRLNVIAPGVCNITHVDEIWDEINRFTIAALKAP